MKTKAEIIENYFVCQCGESYALNDTIDPSCYLHSGCIEEALDEYAAEVAINFSLWLRFNYEYDGVLEMWFPKKGGDKLTSTAVYKEYLKTLNTNK